MVAPRCLLLCVIIWMPVSAKTDLAVSSFSPSQRGIFWMHWGCSRRGNQRLTVRCRTLLQWRHLQSRPDRLFGNIALASVWEEQWQMQTLSCLTDRSVLFLISKEAPIHQTQPIELKIGNSSSTRFRGQDRHTVNHTLYVIVRNNMQCYVYI